MERFFLTKERFVRNLSLLGTKFLLCMVVIEHLLQGFIFGGGTGGIIGIPIIFMLRSYGVLDASRIQVLMTIAVSPWALKPIFGIVADCLYLGGYNKIPYIIGTTLVAIASCVLIVFTWPVSPALATLLFFLLFLQIAFSDLLMEAKYIEKTRPHPDINPDVLTFNHSGVDAGQLLSIIVTGILIGYLPLKYFYLIPIIPFLITLYPIYHNWIDDKEYDPLVHNELTNVCCGSKWWYTRVDDEEQQFIPVVGMDTTKIRLNWRFIVLGLIIVLITLIAGIIGFLDIDSVYLFVFSLVSAPLMIGAFFLLVDRPIAMVQTYSIIQNMCSVSIESAVFFFFTDGPESYPEGPHFSNFFYITVIGVVGTLISIVGILLYNTYMTGWKFRTILVITNLIFILVSVPNIILFKRWNRALGLPDEVFVIGTEVLQVLIGKWSSLPLTVIMQQISPTGVEAIAYALLAGCSNLGRGLSQYQGAFLLDVLGIRPVGGIGESHQFDKLWIASLISIVISFVPIFFIPFLIPDGVQTEQVIKLYAQADTQVLVQDAQGVQEQTPTERNE